MLPADFDAFCDTLDELEAQGDQRAERTIRRIVVEALLNIPGEPFIELVAPKLATDIEALHPEVEKLCAAEARRLEDFVIIPLDQSPPPRPSVEKLRASMKLVDLVRWVSHDADDSGGLVTWFEHLNAVLPASIASTVHRRLLTTFGVTERADLP